MQPYFITATGTGIGKTLLTATLCWQLRQAGRRARALKPVISGFDAKDMHSDTALLLRSCGVTPSAHTMAEISPWRFVLPLSPNLAAAKEKKPAVELEALVEFCRESAALEGDVLLVEGVGGVMAPLNDTQTVLDWMAALGWPVILVAGSYLGSISHTLSALEVLRARGLVTKALVLSESAAHEVSLEDTARGMEPFIGRDLPVVKLPRTGAHSEPWTTQPLISWLCT